jgi:acyl dehydratase
MRAASIKAFAQTFDPQRHHLDEKAARANLLGGLIANGWHRAAAAMRLMLHGWYLFLPPRRRTAIGNA